MGIDKKKAGEKQPATQPAKTKKPKKISTKRLQRSRSAKESYVVLTYEMTESAAWTSLTDPAPWLYIELKKSFKYKLGGNSHLMLPYGQIRWRMSKPTYIKHMRQLVEFGFVRVVKRGGPLGHMPTIYALSERWKEISKEIVDKSGREAIKAGMVKKPRTKDVGRNLNGHRPHEQRRKKREKKQK